jgi:hypothetical protein
VSDALDCLMEQFAGARHMDVRRLTAIGAVAAGQRRAAIEAAQGGAGLSGLFRGLGHRHEAEPTAAINVMPNARSRRFMQIL